MLSMKSQITSFAPALYSRPGSPAAGAGGIVLIVYTLVNLAWTYFHWGGPERVTLITNLFSFSPVCWPWLWPGG